jgi:hypothetical protein
MRCRIPVITVLLRWAGAAGAAFFLLCSYDHLSPPGVPFTVRVSAGSIVLIHDTLKVHLSVPEPGVWGVRYVWSVDSLYRADTTIDSVLRMVFSVRDTGVRRVVIRALDGSGRESPEHVHQVTVNYRRPAVALAADTVCFTGALYVLRISGRRGGSSLDHFTWYIDDPLAAMVTVDTVHSLVWGTEDTGGHVIGACAIDSDGIASTGALLNVRVLSGEPLIEAFRDTALWSDDTLTITCRASDPNGAVVKYLWNFSGGGWDDSTGVSSYRLWYSGSGTVQVTVGARDNDGLLSTAAFTVAFNRPLDTLAVSAPLPVDTLIMPEKDPGGAVSFAYSASDPDGDSIVYSLWWMAETDSAESLVYRGAGRSFLLGGIAPGRYFWRLEARDVMGHALEKSGAMVVIREHRICFVGHSIVVGLGGSDTTGGFRAGVLDSLRSLLGPYERLKAVGPTTSNWYMITSPEDDSCMAVSGISAEILHSAITVVPSLTADIWVLMIGVTDDYNPKGLRYTAALMDLLYSRNMDSRCYVLNANPVMPSMYAANYWVPYFNQGLPDSMAIRVAAGEHIFEVDGFTALTDSAGHYDSTLFADGLHPNVAGYERLRDAVVSAMKTSDPPVFMSRP